MVQGSCDTEADCRRRLGVPDAADQVMVVTESSHWDPNWLMTSEHYHRWCVRPALDAVLDELALQPRRVFSVESMFFLDLYWRDRPERHDQIRHLADRGQLRFSGCGVTTPDTLLPEDEMILRDLLVGQEWLRSRGIAAEPRVLYLPDSFGHSPGLPSLMRAAGLDRAAVCRIDGMRFPGADMESAANFPRPGSSAAALIDMGSADFVWAAPDGAEVLTHWMSHGYGHGDMVASAGVSRAMGLPLSFVDRRPRRVDERIAGYLDDLRPLGRTPYRLLTIGFDFVCPVPRLVELLDDWNERNHDRTGTWLVNATIEDYLDLVDGHRGVLPTVEFDPNPYWTGFYASRPEIKSAARDLGRRLIARDAVRAGQALAGESVEPDVDRTAWWVAVTSNHHDFVTGTSPDRVAGGEQTRWLSRATAATPWPTTRQAEPAEGGRYRQGGTALVWRGRMLVVETAWGAITFDPQRGGTIVDIDVAGYDLVGGVSHDVISYRDSGGLWRMGQEIHGGRWSRVGATSDVPATVRATVCADGTARVVVSVRLEDRPMSIVHSVDPARPLIITTVSGTPRLRRSITLAVRGTGPAVGVMMHQPGAVIERSLERWYRPTFWPLHSFAAPIRDDSGSERGGGMVVAAANPTGVHVSGDGTVEMVVARTAVKETAFGAIPVMAPAWGLRFGSQRASVAVDLTSGDVIARGRRLSGLLDAAVGRPAPAFPVAVDDIDVDVVAVKPASRGEGVVVRLRNWAPRHERTARLELSGPGSLTGASIVDSRERDLMPLAITGGGAEIPLVGHLVSVRLLSSAASCGAGIGGGEGAVRIENAPPG